MGHGLSCGRDTDKDDLFRAARAGDLDALEGLLAADPSLVRRATIYGRLTALHVAAAKGCLPAVSIFLARGARPDALSRSKRTPLMLAAKHGHIDCALALLNAGANILLFDSVHARTCLHHAAYYGHVDCLRAILAAARTTQVAGSWGFARFVNVRDMNGATPLHLAAWKGRPECVHMLLESGAVVSAPTGCYVFPGSTPLHLAACGGHVGCVRELLAWGADRVQRDSLGRIAYVVAAKKRLGAWAALLNPSAVEPIVWPSALTIIGELEADARALLEAALAEANIEREKKILLTFKGTAAKESLPAQSGAIGVDSDEEEEDGEERCSICFEQTCSIEVRDCGHQMCAACTLALCCRSKPDPRTLMLQPPSCPFCRSSISRLVVAKTKAMGPAASSSGFRA